MELIKDLGTRRVGTATYSVRYGLFKCPDCGKEVERIKQSGKKTVNCGCNKDHIRKGRSKTWKTNNIFFGN